MSALSQSSDPSVDPASLPYRACVGVMVLNEAGLVWTGRRISKGNTEYDGSPQLWQMPQGGIDPGEEAEPAARRELHEETGITSITLIEALARPVRYDLPDHMIGTGLRGRYRGQEQRWFAYRFTGTDSEIAIDPPPDGNTAEFDAWAWKPMAELPGLIVPFKRAVYEEVVAGFAHLAGTGA